MIKRLDDGSLAVGLFNRGEKEMEIAAKWSDLGLTGKQRVRDLWRQKDLGEFDGQFSAAVGGRGAEVVRFQPLDHEHAFHAPREETAARGA